MQTTQGQTLRNFASDLQNSFNFFLFQILFYPCLCLSSLLFYNFFLASRTTDTYEMHRQGEREPRDDETTTALRVQHALSDTRDR